MAMVLVLGMIGLTACATAPRLGAPLDASPRWRVAETEHFVLFSAPDETALATTADELELAYRAMRAMPGLPLDGGASDTRLAIVVVTTDDSAPLPAVTPGDTPIVVRGPLRGSLREALLQQVARRTLGDVLPQAPWWVRDGLAEYLSTLVVHDGALVVGERPRRFDTPVWLGDPEELVRAPDASTIPRADRKAWALVHLLQQDGEHLGVFRRYLEKLGAGVDADRAWRETQERLPWRTFRRDFGDYLRRDPHATWRVRLPSHKPTFATTRTENRVVSARDSRCDAATTH